MIGCDMMRLELLLLAALCLCSRPSLAEYEDKHSQDSEEPKEAREPTPCEVCRVVAHEMDEKLKATSAKLKLDLGSKLEGPGARKVDYSRSEVRLIEVLDTACDKVNTYAVHVKEGMQRYAKQESDTLDALNSLRRKGVKVEIGLPWEIVDKQPNKEIMALKRKCEAIVEDYEDDLSAWYFQQQEKPLIDFLCRERILKNGNQTCLEEEWKPYGERKPTTDEEMEAERVEGRRKQAKWKEEELAGKKTDLGQKVEL